MKLLTPEDFLSWVGKKVRVATVPQPVELLLTRVQRNPEWAGMDFREPFSLFFEAPLDIHLIDETYQFDCGVGGPHNIHISQMPPTPKTRHYQAVFN